MSGEGQRTLWLKALFTTVLSLGALSFQVTAIRSEEAEGLPSAWRYWDDLTLGAARYIDATSPTPKLEGQGTELKPLVDAFRGPMEEKVRTFNLRSYEFWRTVPDQKFRNLIRPYAAPEFEDAGRSLLLGYGFRVLGGVAPYLLVWIGVLFFAPVWLWLNYELFRARFALAALSLSSFLALSPFIVGTLTLPHSAVAFYLGALSALAAFSIATFADPPKLRGVVFRSILLSFVMVVAIWCRGGSLCFLPVGVFLAWQAFRSGGGLAPLRSALAALLLLALPAFALRPQRAHNVWLSLWEGLGDFGADRGYSWWDKDANSFLREHGLAAFTDPKLVTREQEEVFHQSFLAGISSAPLWYCSVLLKRVVATVGLTKLSPYGPWDGESRSAPYFHYKYTTPIDWFGWRGSWHEVPVFLLWGPTLILLFAIAFGRGVATEFKILAPIALAALPVPVLVSTASGIETEAFGLTYFLGASLLLQRAASQTRFFRTAT